jgi:hypothetical protein
LHTDDEPRSPLEWVFDALAAIGLVLLVIGFLVRSPFEYMPTLVYSVFGLALLAGGMSGSRWCKKKRLAALRGRRIRS